MRILISVLMVAALLSACDGSSGVGAAASAPAASLGDCVADGAPLVLQGSFGSADAKTYHMLPFRVGTGTGRIEMSYGWTDKSGLPSTPLTATTLDLGLWDEHGYRATAGFRGWSGSRQGRIDQNQSPIYVQADAAERGYIPGPIHPGVWYADLGVGAVIPQGTRWTVKLVCKRAPAASALADDPVDRTHVANRLPGWYAGDFHMHAYHSNPKAPDWPQFIDMARAAKLDFLMVTEYVTSEHWHTLGAVQRANPDLLIWPGREVITYHGHVSSLGETPDEIEFRHGFEDVNIRDIQRGIKADGALFQVNHPTSFPPPVFTSFCRGCYFELGDQIDWDQVDTIEILNGPVLATGSDLGLSLSQPEIESPFLTTALLLWDSLLQKGHKITGVSGTDSKGVEPNESERERRGYGSSATMVYASELSRPALTAGIKAGHAYVKTRGVARSPSIQFEAYTADGRHAIFGDTLQVGATEAVTLRTTVTGGAGQLLTYYQNGLPVLVVPILTDPFVHEFALATRNPLTEGPLGTYWRIETRDLQSRTTLGNPIFLKGT